MARRGVSTLTTMLLFGKESWSRSFVLFSFLQLQDVLTKSDRAMAVVRDLFGDDPRKYRGLPNVTAAPNHADLTDLDRFGLHQQAAGPGFGQGEQKVWSSGIALV